MDSDDIDLFNLGKIQVKTYSELKDQIDLSKEGIGIKSKNKIVTGFVQKKENFDVFYTDLCKKANISEKECRDMTKTEIYRVNRPKNPTNEIGFIKNYFPMAFFTIIATAIAWEIARNYSVILLKEFTNLYGEIIANILIFVILILTFFLFLAIGFSIFKNWKNEQKYDYEFMHFPH